MVLESDHDLTEIMNKLGPTVDREKLGLLIQGLLIKIVQVCIFESSISYSSKNLFNTAEDISKFYKVEKRQIEREIVHNLFLQGASTTVDKINKSSDKLYSANPAFMTALVEFSTSQTESSGKKTFRLKDDYLPMYDPYYYVTEK